MKRRRAINPAKARQAALGSFYDRIEVTQAGWPTCSTCGRQAAIVDLERLECMRCKVERKKAEK